MKTDELSIRINKKALKFLGIGILIGLVIGIVFVLIVVNGIKNKQIQQVKIDTESAAKSEEKEITIEYLSKKLEKISELSTAEMIYNAIITVETGKIPYITQKGFSMYYTAYIKAGIDASLIKPEIKEKEVIVTLPKPEIQTLYIDPDSIEFYNEKWALFNRSEKQDVVEAVSMAEDDAERNANLTDLKDRALDQAEIIIRGLLEDAIDDRSLIIKYE